VFLSSVAFGQSKKKQIESLNKSLDSLNYVLEAERKLNKEQIDKVNQNLEDANQTILKSNKKINRSNARNVKLRNKITMLNIKQDSLINQLELSLKNQNKISYVIGRNIKEPEAIEPLYTQNEFDFQFLYTNGNGFNPPIIFPIGWSYNGNIAYKEDYCDGGCGCCQTAIVVRDLNSNQTLKTQNTSLIDYIEGDESDKSIWADINYCNSFSEIINDYNIIPIGFGNYSTSNVIEKNNYNNSYFLEIILETNNNIYELKTKTKDNTVKLEYRGNLKYDEITETWNSVEYAGHFINNINNYAAIALMHISYGYEGEIDYNIEFIGIKLPGY